MSEIKVYRLNASGSNPTIEVIFGQANWGNYQTFIYDSNGKNPILVSEGVNTDEIPDKAEIGNVAELNNRILYWRLRTARFDSSPGGRFYMKVIVSQAGNEPHVNEYQGEFSGLVQDAIGILRFDVL
jgi:hypothetical protein